MGGVPVTNPVVVLPYDPVWVERFSQLRDLLWPAVKDFALSIEHVGSTSVPGLAAKPIIDIDIVIPDASLLDRAISALDRSGYDHRGNLGIEGRHAFRARQENVSHNLYVCFRDALSLRNHLCLRDALRADPALRDEYGALKLRLALQFPKSIDDYIEGKTEFILRILSSHGYAPDKLEAIRAANVAPLKLRA